MNAKTEDHWLPISEFNLGWYDPCIVWGILEGECSHASHEAFNDSPSATPESFKSVRKSEVIVAPESIMRHMRINNVTHFMPMPGNPNE